MLVWANKKLGEINNEDMMNGLMEAPNKLVCIGYTFQDKNGTQMSANLKTKDFIEEDNDLEDDEDKDEEY